MQTEPKLVELALQWWSTLSEEDKSTRKGKHIDSMIENGDYLLLRVMYSYENIPSDILKKVEASMSDWSTIFGMYGRIRNIDSRHTRAEALSFEHSSNQFEIVITKDANEDFATVKKHSWEDDSSKHIMYQSSSSRAILTLIRKFDVEFQLEHEISEGTITKIQ